MKKKKHRRNVDFNKFIRLKNSWQFPLSLIVPPHPPSQEPRVWDGLDGEKQGLDTTNTYRHIKPPSIKLTFLLSSPAQIFLFTLNFHLPGLLQEMVELRLAEIWTTLIIFHGRPLWSGNVITQSNKANYEAME